MDSVEITQAELFLMYILKTHSFMIVLVCSASVILTSQAI